MKNHMIKTLQLSLSSFQNKNMFRRPCKQNFYFLKSVLQSYYHQNAHKSDYIRTTVQDHLYLIGINRPNKKNCVNLETAIQLRKAFQNFSVDENAYVAVLYGIGGSFCAGYDLQEVSDGIFPDVNADGPMGPTRMFLSKPVIAAIDGYAVAGGMELALWCDLRVMEETAFLGVLCRRFGVPLIDGGTVRLPHLIGLARSLELILTGRKVGAKEAFEIGLVTKLCKKGEAYNVAVEIASNLCQMPQNYLKANLKAAYGASYKSDLKTF